VNLQSLDGWVSGTLRLDLSVFGSVRCLILRSSVPVTVRVQPNTAIRKAILPHCLPTLGSSGAAFQAVRRVGALTPMPNLCTREPHVGAV
jgi:hypothetical protein